MLKDTGQGYPKMRFPKFSRGSSGAQVQEIKVGIGLAL